MAAADSKEETAAAVCDMLTANSGSGWVDRDLAWGQSELPIWK